MSDKQKLEQILHIFSGSSKRNVRLYFITKHLKEGVSRTEKVLNKYKYECIRVNIEDDLQEYFFNLLKNQLNSTISNDDIEFTEFEIIDDDLRDRVYTYALNNASSFHDLLTNKMASGVDIPYVSSLMSISDDLCAYSISIEDGECIRLISFRKISKSKIASEESKGIKTLFRPNDRRLICAKGESINFDEKIDCVFFDGDFFVFHKKSFENLAGLDDEYKEMAYNVLEEIAETELVFGLNLLIEEAGKSKLVAKQLAKFSKTGGHKNLNQNRIEKMQELCVKLGLNLKIDGGKIVIDDSKDAKLLIRLLDQYYVACMQTGDAFGSHAKTKIDIAKR